VGWRKTTSSGQVLFIAIDLVSSRKAAPSLAGGINIYLQMQSGTGDDDESVAVGFALNRSVWRTGGPELTRRKFLISCLDVGISLLPACYSE
jgi:hypothetical protein